MQVAEDDRGHTLSHPGLVRSAYLSSGEESATTSETEPETRTPVPTRPDFANLPSVFQQAMKDMLAYLEKFITDKLSDAQENLEEHISNIRLSVNEEAVELNSQARDVKESATALEKLVRDLNQTHIPTLQKHKEMTESICKSQKMTEVTLSAIQAQLGSLTSHLERNLQQ